MANWWDSRGLTRGALSPAGAFSTFYNDGLSPRANLPPVQSGPQVDGKGNIVDPATGRAVSAGSQSTLPPWLESYLNDVKAKDAATQSENRSRYDNALSLLGLGSNGATGAAPMNAVMAKADPAQMAKMQPMRDADTAFKSAANEYYLARNRGASASEIDSLKTKMDSLKNGAWDAGIAAGGRQVDNPQGYSTRTMSFDQAANGGVLGSSTGTNGATIGGNSGNPGVGVPVTSGAGATPGPAYAPQTAAVNQDSVRRGILNTQPALNAGYVTNSLALQQGDLELRDRQFRDEQASQDQNNFLLQQKLRLLEAPVSTGPDMNAAMEIAARYGQGSQQGLDDQSFGFDVGSGGGGGAPIFGSGSSAGFSIPNGSWGTPTMSYGASRSSSVALPKAKVSQASTAAAIRAKQAEFELSKRNAALPTRYGASLSSSSPPVLPGIQMPKLSYVSPGASNFFSDMNVGNGLARRQ